MAGNRQIGDAKSEQALMVEIWSPELANDPLAFVLFAFPWGKPNTPLEHIKGPRQWQADILRDIAQHIKANELRSAQRLTPEMLREAVASGRGIGKSALVSWLTIWMMSCHIGSTTIVTANTEQQLRSRTWAEVSKWAAMAINAHWFDVTATSMKPAGWYAELLTKQLKIDAGYYYAQAQLWSEENPDAFAGAHNPKGLTLIFDEASGIPTPIWTVSEGFFTEASLQRYWFAFSNPRRNTGSFFECFHKNRNFWKIRNIDSRSVEENDQAIYQRIVDQYGEDSDEARVEVKGQFPNQGARQFIANALAYDAQQREVGNDYGAPLLMGVDVARFGEDRSVIAFRQGRDARSIEWQKYKGLDTVQLTQRVAEAADKYKPSAIFVDGNGVGGGVVDQLKAYGYKVIEVQAGGSPGDLNKYINKRVEMWDLMREWLMIGAIPEDPELFTDLTSPEFDYSPTTNQLKLERKDEMKKRHLASPDIAEALALTFSMPVARTDVRHSRAYRRNTVAMGMDYDILA